MTILVFDSGLGGLTVADEILGLFPDEPMVYLADTARFPYGDLPPDEMVGGVVGLIEEMVRRYDPSTIVIACNTAATLVLPPLRARFAIPVVGTVPAVKPAAEMSRTRRASVLATPATVRRDYTHELIAIHGGDCAFDLIGSPHLAMMAEAELNGTPASDAAILAEIASAFVDRDGRRTDTIVLACTHYPWLLDRFRRLAPWPVTWIDSAPAIARRVAQVKPAGKPAGGAAKGSTMNGGARIFIATGAGPADPVLAARGFRRG